MPGLTGNPEGRKDWIPAFAGMTNVVRQAVKVKNGYCITN